MPDPGLYTNPNEMESTSPVLFYPNGVLENYVNPINELTFRGEGALLPVPSDESLTIIPDVAPEVMPTPGMNIEGYIPTIATHEGHAADTSEPRSLAGLQATETWYQQPPAVDKFLGMFSSSPVAALFLGLAALLIFNSVVLRNSGVSRGARRAGAGAAGVGAAAAAGGADTASAGIQAVNDAVGGAVEAVEGIGG